MTDNYAVVVKDRLSVSWTTDCILYCMGVLNTWISLYN